MIGGRFFRWSLCCRAPRKTTVRGRNLELNYGTVLLHEERSLAAAKPRQAT